MPDPAQTDPPAPRPRTSGDRAGRQRGARGGSHGRARWVLTIACLLLFTAWLLSGYGRLSYEWGTGRIGLGSRGVSFYLYTQRQEHAQGFDSTWQSNTPQWFHATWCQWDAGLFAMGCSLLLPAMCVGLFALAGWYRRVFAFDRPRRPNRARQFRISRWVVSTLCVAMVGLSIANYWYRIRWLTPWCDLKFERGQLWWTWGGSSSASFVGNVSVDAITDPSTSRIFILYEWLRLGSTATLQMSVWLATALLAALAAFLWFLCQRRYPFDGGCPNPACRYDRKGIPEDVACPECGEVPAKAADSSP